MSDKRRVSFVHNEDLSRSLQLRREKLYVMFHSHVRNPSENIMVSCPLGYNSKRSDITHLLGIAVPDRRVVAAGVKPCVAALSHTLVAMGDAQEVRNNPTLSARLRSVHRAATVALRMDVAHDYKREMAQAGTTSIGVRS